MAYGIKTPNKMPPGRKPFHEGASTVPQGRQETIRPHRFGDGQDAMGTPAGNVQAASNRGYLEGRKDNAILRGNPHPNENNPSVRSKSDKRYGKNSTHGEQPATLEQRQLASGLHSREAHTPGKLVHETVGHQPDGSGTWKDPSHPNSSKGRQSPEHQHTVRREVGTAVRDGNHPGVPHHHQPAPVHDTASRPSGKTITK